MIFELKEMLSILSGHIFVTCLWWIQMFQMNAITITHKYWFVEIFGIIKRDLGVLKHKRL